MAFAVAALVVVITLAIGPSGSSSPPGTTLATNPNLDPGTPLSGTAPGFDLLDQFGQRVSLRSLRGHVVVLAFIDARCTVVCPQTTTTMVRAKRLLGASAAGLRLIAINTNAQATSVGSVHAYSQAHGALTAWQFLTGSPAALRQAWGAYHISVSRAAGQVEQTPALYVITRTGKLAKLYETQPSYAGVDQEAQVLAEEISRLLPGKPRVPSPLSYAEIADIGPTAATTLPRAGGGSVRIGPDRSPRLYVFFASWLEETLDLTGDLDALNAYQRIAAARHLPALTAIDEATVEPSGRSLSDLLERLAEPLRYPVALDSTGRVADGYLVQDQPWFVLVSRSGAVLWYSDASTQGWPTVPALVQHVLAALSTKPNTKPPPASQIPRLLAGSPPPLSAIHRQAGLLLGSFSALKSRLRALRGYPVVVNAWASWCGPCQAEYPLFAEASVHYGRQVAFLGVDTLDYGASYARAFLARHALSYPSYQAPNGELPGLAAIEGLPTTIYIDRAGAVVKVVSGQYDSLGALDGDITHYLGL